LLAVQGLDDEYGTLEQIHGIAERAPQTEILELPDCGHSPQRDQNDSLLRHAVDIIDRNRHVRYAG
jgi:pimeloyl-ACP methyl ester carboxylesterase